MLKRLPSPVPGLHPCHILVVAPDGVEWGQRVTVYVIIIIRSLPDAQKCAGKLTVDMQDVAAIIARLKGV